VVSFDFASGTRVVVRYRLPDGRATDALGWVHVSDATHCVIATRRGLETIALADILLAKEVPPPPAPRPRQGTHPESD
jgi:hypothetical protein